MLPISLACAAVLASTAIAMGQRPVLEVEPVVRIGAVDGPEEYVFGSSIRPALLPGGQILVLDNQARRARVYDLQGRHLFSFGRDGSGPGEFAGPLGAVLIGNTIQIFDSRLQRFSVFTLGGQHIETRPGPSNAGQITNPHLLRDGSWIAQNPSGMSSQNMQSVIAGRAREVGTGIVRVVHIKTATVDTLASYQGGHAFWFDEEGGRSFGGVETTFGDAGYLTVSGDSLVATVDAIQGRITWWTLERSRLVPRSRIDLALEPMPVTRAELDEIRRRLRAQGKGISRFGLVAPDYRAHFVSAVIHDRGSLWLRRSPPEVGSSRANENEYLVLRPDGAVQTVRFPSGFALANVLQDRLVGTTRDEMDVQYVAVYTIRNRLP